MQDKARAPVSALSDPRYPKELHPQDALFSSANIIANGSAAASNSYKAPTKTPKRPARPSTAPSQDQVALLPAAFRSHTISLPASPSRESPSKGSPRSTSEVRKALQGLQGVPDDSVGKDVRSLNPSEFDLASDPGYALGTSDCDWATFVTAYAMGRWDPHKIPNPPRSYLCFPGDTIQPPPQPRLVREVIHASHSLPRETEYTVETEESLRDSSVVASAVDSMPDSTNSVGTASTSPTSKLQHRNTINLLPFELSLPGSSSHRSRNSFSSSASTSSFGGSTASSTTTSSKTEIQAAAATMRWAAARVDISPLALPSPEHELTDPMRGVTAALPVSYPEDPFNRVTEKVATPGGTRRSRLCDFWEGTTAVDDTPPTSPSATTTRPLKRISLDGSSYPLASKPGNMFRIEETSPTPDESVTSSLSLGPSSALSDPTTQLSILAAPPPATAPILGGGSQSRANESGDYFGDATPPSGTRPINGVSPSSLSQSGQSAFSNAVDLNSVDSDGTLTVPALPRRVCLTRQTSSPLPMPQPHEMRLPGGRLTSDNVIPSIKAGRSAKEEQMYNELGYLAPPNPPDELERRRALYKFNILNTGPDLNFDRIAHLAKLVFNTKGVIISLIDGNEQWFKSEFGSMFSQGGSPARSCPRTQSLCGHSILQRGDEPTMVLDTHLDWRFANNPLVTGPTQVRFYAGAPLRTQDGFNIGTLAVFDDAPREDFTPRQRHTLKEFAAIAMRELELWRDKIQLRIRDRIQSSMEQFSRECLESDNEVYTHGQQALKSTGENSMEQVYDRAAKLVQRTLDVEGVIVLDVSHCEVLENMSAEGRVSVIVHHGDVESPTETRQISQEEYHKFNRFFEKHPDGRILEGILPHLFRPYMPTHIRYALTVPIFNIDKRPFALICAYNTNDHSKRFLEGHELSYLRAIGVIILSAVLKRRMILADKAKSLFISNISHELRTPLHGILAAAELLSDSPLTHSQMSFIQTVQACGTSLVETVNHVLDFTKLSGNTKAGGAEKVIVPTMTDLMQLIEDAIDGSWIGHRARTAIMGDSMIGSVYSPPSDDDLSPSPKPQYHVETVIDIGYREMGWLLNFEKGGIRRVLMNLFGNSLKFTTDGYVHVRARSLPLNADDPPGKVRVELAVQDTGKGISSYFQKNLLFQPFSQENPLQTGTGLGLAIVNSIIRSENVDGKLDVLSEEGNGTEIKFNFLADAPKDPAQIALSSQEVQPFRMEDGSPLPTVSLLGFDDAHRGVQLLRKVVLGYLQDWWAFPVNEGPELGDIVVVNEDIAPLMGAVQKRDVRRPFVILWGARGDPTILAVTSEYERMGGFCRILYKPGGPTRLRAIMKLSIHALKMGHYQYRKTSPPVNMMPGYVSQAKGEADRYSSAAWRRNSDESYKITQSKPTRPSMARAITLNPLSNLRQIVQSDEAEASPSPPGTPVDPVLATIPVGSGGSLLKSAVKTTAPEVQQQERRPRVLVVEDNSLLRNLLAKWLVKKNYDFKEAVDGLEGVNIFREEGPFDVVVIDLSMPVLDGVAATKQMRRIESESGSVTPELPRPTKILALTGMSSLEDKRKAFDAGVDGYLVKPVAFKTLEDMFTKLGIS